LAGQVEISHRMDQTKSVIKKPPKGYYNPLRGFTWSSFGKPTFSLITPEG
jgi:hypothetical protein